MIELREDWEFNVLGVYNFRKPGPFDAYYQYIKDNHSRIEGDILEAGVYRGSSLLATALLLKELNSSKKVYGFDSFSGFPPVYHDNDNIDKFDELAQEGRITSKHLAAVKRNKRWRENFMETTATVSNISSSSNFSQTSLELVQSKIELLELDNIVLVEGDFEDTMKGQNPPEKIMCTMMDCDLYESYLTTFGFVWPRLSINGLIYLDEYYSLKFPGAKIATDEFLADVDAELCMAPLKEGDFERWYISKKR